MIFPYDERRVVLDPILAAMAPTLALRQPYLQSFTDLADRAKAWAEAVETFDLDVPELAPQTITAPEPARWKRATVSAGPGWS